MRGFFDVPKERDQIGLFDVERRAEPLLSRSNVGLGEADAKLRWRVGRAVSRHG